MSISALFGFKWPFGGSDEPSKAGGQQLPVDVLFTSYACVAPEYSCWHLKLLSALDNSIVLSDVCHLESWAVKAAATT